MSPIVKLGLAVLALAGFIAPASAQDYPNRAVKIIVPFGAGGQSFMPPFDTVLKPEELDQLVAYLATFK